MNARWKLAGALGALALTVVPAGAGAASLPAGTTAILSGTPDLLSAFPTPVDASAIASRAVSRDGSRVVFTSDADGLSGEDDDAVDNIYVKDLTTGAVQLVSRASGEHGEPAHANCADGAISADGHQVAFECDGPLDPADTNGFSDVYVRNLDTQTTTLVSRAPGRAVGDDKSFTPSIAVSGGTAFVAFESDATDLLGGAPLRDAARIYRATVTGGVVGSVALASGNGDPADISDTLEPSISDDGSRVAFATTGSLNAADPGGDLDVYVRDFNSGATIFASRQDGAAGAGLPGSASAPAISGDGTAVAFMAGEPLDPAHDVQPNSEDVYLRSLSAGRTTLVSAKPDGTASGRVFGTLSIDATGNAVAFISDAAGLTPDSKPGVLSVYVFRSGVGVRLASRGGAAGLAVPVVEMALSRDGGTLAFVGFGIAPDADPNVFVVVARDLAGGVNRTVSRPPGAEPFVNAGGVERGGALSADGRFAAFVSEAPALGAPGGGVFVRDLATGAVTLASRADGASGAPLAADPFDLPSISADGQRVAFAAFTPSNGEQVFVRDLAAGRTFEASVADGAGGAPGDHDSFGPSLDADGQRVAFTSEAANLSASDRDTTDDVYVRDLATGRTTLVDVVGGTAAKVAGKMASQPAISGDGLSVAFTSSASLDPAIDTSRSNVTNVFVRSLDEGTTVLASVAGTATLGDRRSSVPSIDRGGNRVGFLSDATTFGALGNEDQLFVRDLAAKTLTLASRADGAAGAPPTEVSDGRLSADGQHVAFAASASASMAPGDPGDGFVRVYTRALAGGGTRLVSRRSGADGAALTGPGDDPDLGGISADGGCVSFEAEEPLLPGQSFSRFGNVYVRAVSSNCGRPDPTPPSPGPGAVPGGGGRTPVAVLSKLALKPARFHVGGRKGGTKISFRLDRTASVTLAFDRLLPGRRAKAKKVHGRKGKLGPCSTKRRHGGVRCTVVKRFGRLVLAQSKLHAGANTVKFSGRIGRKALVPGRYRLTATPSHGKARTVGFVVVKAPKAHKRKARR